jgi:TonB-linked SusC/RagA family outer membrane protein
MQHALGDGSVLLCRNSFTQQLLRMLKRTAILLLAACLMVSAGGYAQNITLSEKNAPLEKIFREIKKQAGYTFLYSSEVMKQARKVDIEVRNAKLEYVLNSCFAHQPLTWEMDGKIIIVKPKPVEETKQGSAATPIDVHGKVENEKKEPVVASISIKGTNRGTTTNEKGAFELKAVEDNAVLVVSGITIETFEVKIGGRTDLAVLSAKRKVTAMDDVQVTVNTGYQKISRERFVGSYSQLDSTMYNLRAGTDILQRLDGTVTGILFDKKSRSSSLELIQVRGLSTLNSSRAPLIVVDNFPFKQDISLLNQNDIESITVLKDAAATSIWGAQAGNGVIVITTRKGKYNKPLSVSFSSNISIREKPDLYYTPLMSSSDFIDMEIFLFNKGYYDNDLNNTAVYLPVTPVVELLAKRRAGKLSAQDSAGVIDGYRSMDVRRDVDRYAFRKAIMQQYSLNVGGGTNLFNYNISAGYRRDLNGTRNSKPNDGYNVNVTAGLIPVKKLEINTQLSYAKSTGRSVDFSFPGRVYPYAQLADEEGRALALPTDTRMGYLDTVGAGQLLDWKFRPLDEVRLADNTINAHLVMLGTSVNYRFRSWINASLNYQYNMQLVDGSYYNSMETYYTRSKINGYTNLSSQDPAIRNPLPVGAILLTSHAASVSQNARGQLNINKLFSGKHAVTALVAGEVSETKTAGNENHFYGFNKEFGTYATAVDYVSRFPVYGLPNYYQQIPNISAYRPGTKNRFVSYLANASYTYNGRITLYVSARKDGANIFGANTNRKWKPLWSVAGSWDIAREHFFKVAWMPQLKIRASYGYSGNPGTVSAVPTISYRANPAPITGNMYALTNEAPNPDLRWEKNRTINLALDFSFLQNRLSGMIDVYRKQSTDLISSQTVAPSSGFISLTNVNIANLEVKGFEIRLQVKNIQKKYFEWTTGWGLSHAKTVVTKLFTKRVRTADFASGDMNPSEGQIVFGLTSYRWAGLDANGNPMGYLNKQVSTDYNAILNDSFQNQVFNGSSIPLYYGNMTNSISWKNFSFTANISYRLAFYYRRPALSYSSLAQQWSGHAEFAARWQKPGDEKITNVPSLVYPLMQNRDGFYQNAEINVLRGDNVRLSDLQLNYRWNGTSAMPFNNLSVFMNVNNLNLILWRKDKSVVDPDYAAGSLLLYPTPKNWTIGVVLNL